MTRLMSRGRHRAMPGGGGGVDQARPDRADRAWSRWLLGW